MHRPNLPAVVSATYNRRSGDKKTRRHWRVGVVRWLVPVGLIAVAADAINAPTAAMRIPLVVAAFFLTTLWATSLMPHASRSRRMARFGDAMILCALLAPVAGFAWILFVQGEVAAAGGIRRIALWFPLIALYTVLMLARRLWLGVAGIAGLMALMIGLQLHTMASFGVSVLPDSIVNFVAQTCATAGAAIVFGRYRNGLSETFARLQVAESESMTDALTGLPNRRRFRFDSASRVVGATPHCLMLLDLDKFKRVNDTRGHHVGDTTLVAFSEAVSERLPESATLYRWGGEEFVILAFMPRTDVKALAESLRRHIEVLELLPGLRVTVSLGVTEILPDESVDAAFQRADAALYEAKHAGRNRSVFRAA